MIFAPGDNGDGNAATAAAVSSATSDGDQNCLECFAFTEFMFILPKNHFRIQAHN